MRVAALDLVEVELPLVQPFETSFGVERRRRVLLVALRTPDGLTGWGECVAAEAPRYSSETVATARSVLVDHLVPALARLASATPESFARATGWVRGHRMARAAVEMALWDLAAKRRGTSLARALGGRRRRVEVGVSVGIHPTVPRLLAAVGGYLDAGYLRVKLKVRPGWDEVPVRAVRREYPDLRLWVDANQAYGIDSLPAIARWARRHDVEIFEQPFPERALSLHAKLVRTGATRVALDESVVDAATYEEAEQLGAMGALNVKPGRVGGLAMARDLAGRARRRRISVWVGGMLETGIGRAHNVALASMEPFTLPADLSASARYFAHDLIGSPFELGPGSTLAVPTGAGIGVELDSRWFRRYVRRRRRYVLHR